MAESVLKYCAISVSFIRQHSLKHVDIIIQKNLLMQPSVALSTHTVCEILLSIH